MRLNAIDSLQRGILNVFANWQLLVVYLGQTLLVSLLMVAGAVPIVLALGLETLRAIVGSETSGGGPPLEAIDDLLSGLAESSGHLILAAVVATVVWTVALLVLAYFQAGIFGVLADADRRAPRPVAVSRDFRSFSLSGFRRSAETFVWRFFWLVNLLMLFSAIPMAIFAGVALLAMWLVTGENVGGAVAVGCLGLLALLVLSVLASLWWQLAMAAAVSRPATLWAAVRQSLRILFRRFGAVLVLMLLAIVVGITMAVVFVPVGIVLEVVVRDSWWGYVGSQIVMAVVQSLFSGGLNLVFAAALVAMARGELPDIEMQGA